MNHPRRLYLVRHGEAKPKDEDPLRGLTVAGETTVHKVAQWAAAVGIQVDEIRHSGKLRAEQTASLLAAALTTSGHPLATHGLDPADDVRPVADLLDGEDRTVMLVGHLPFLGRLVSQLVVGDPDQAIVAFDAAALVRLSKFDSQWVVEYVVQPELLV
jgi:phosphohistidine phosphatase